MTGFHRFNLTLKRSKSGTILIVIGLVLFGFLIRIDDLRFWNQHPEQYFVEGRPIPSRGDGYYYLRFARDLLEGTYHSKDPLRLIPDGKNRPLVPLLSLLIATISEIGGIPLEWVAIWLPPIMGSLLVIPLYLLGCFYGGRAMGVSAALCATVSIVYMTRTKLGALDTDIMIVPFVLFVTYFFLKFGTIVDNRRYRYYIAGLASALLFFLWWDTAPIVSTLLSAAPLFVSLLFYYRPKTHKEIYAFIIFHLAAVILLMYWQGPGLFEKLNENLRNILHVLTGGGREFPNPGRYVSELRPIGFIQMTSSTTGDIIIFLLSIIGILWFFADMPMAVLYLSPLIGLSALSPFFGNRFLIFLAPVTGIGFGYLAHRLWQYRKRYRSLFFLTPLCLLISVVPAVQHELKHQSFNPINHLIPSFRQLERLTPPDAVVWTTWSSGYYVNYWGRRGSVVDGETFADGKRLTFVSYPFMVHDQRLAANFMQFFCTRGMAGIQSVYEVVGGNWTACMDLMNDVFAFGPRHAEQVLSERIMKSNTNARTIDDWIRFFYPDSPKPIYLLLHAHMFKEYSWYYYGTMNMSNMLGKTNPLRLVYPLAVSDKLIEGRRFFSGEPIFVIIANGRSFSNNQELKPLSDLLLQGKHKAADRRIRYNREEGPMLEIAPARDFAVLHIDNRHETDSVFNQLFIEGRSVTEYFSIALDNRPFMQLWRVRGDRWEPGEKK